MKTKTLAFKKWSTFLALASAFVAAVLTVYPTQTRANTVALDFTGGAGLPFNGTLGWAFSLSTAVLVTNLGLWDDFSNGLTTSHQVTIWTSAGVQVATAMVDNSGTFVASSEAGFRYVSVAPTPLAPGDYTIGGFYEGFVLADRSIVITSTITTASEVMYQGSRSIEADAFPPGNALGFLNGYFGPNFQFTTALDGNGNGNSVPESSDTILLMFGSLAGLVVLRRILPAAESRAV